MDRAWMRERLEEFRAVCDEYAFSSRDGSIGDSGLQSRMHRLEPTARAILRTLDPDLADFNLDTMAGEYEGVYAADKGLGMLADLDEVATRLRPEAPTLPADQLHPWVWDAARTFWDAGAHAVAVEQAAKSITAHTQQKTGCQLADDDLMSQIWSDEPPKVADRDSASPATPARRRGSPGSGAPGRWPRAASAASGTSPPTSTRPTGRNSLPLSTSRACQSSPAGSTRPKSTGQRDSSRGWVRTGSARHREPPVLAGHERSRPVRTNRSSKRLLGQKHG